MPPPPQGGPKLRPERRCNAAHRHPPGPGPVGGRKGLQLPQPAPTDPWKLPATAAELGSPASPRGPPATGSLIRKAPGLPPLATSPNKAFSLLQRGPGSQAGQEAGTGCQLLPKRPSPPTASPSLPPGGGRCPASSAPPISSWAARGRHGPLPTTALSRGADTGAPSPPPPPPGTDSAARPTSTTRCTIQLRPRCRARGETPRTPPGPGARVRAASGGAWPPPAGAGRERKPPPRARPFRRPPRAPAAPRAALRGPRAPRPGRLRRRRVRPARSPASPTAAPLTWLAR